MLSPEETIRAFHERRARLNAKIDRQIERITALLENKLIAAAIKEGDEMLANGTGERYTSVKALFEDLDN